MHCLSELLFLDRSAQLQFIVLSHLIQAACRDAAGLPEPDRGHDLWPGLLQNPAAGPPIAQGILIINY